MVFVLAILECTGTMYIWTKTFMPSWQYEQSACLAGRCTPPPPPPGGACAGQVFTSTSSKPTQISRGHRQGEEEKEEEKVGEEVE